MPIFFFFFTGTLYFLCRLVFRKYEKCPQAPCLFASMCNALSVNDSKQQCLSGLSNVSKRVTLDGSGFLTAFLGREEQLSLYI